MRHPKSYRDELLERRYSELRKLTLYAGRATVLEYNEYALLEVVKEKEYWKAWASARYTIETHTDMILATSKHPYSKDPAISQDDGTGDRNIWRVLQKQFETVLDAYDKELKRIQDWNNGGKPNVIHKPQPVNATL